MFSVWYTWGSLPFAFIHAHEAAVAWLMQGHVYYVCQEDNFMGHVWLGENYGISTCWLERGALFGGHIPGFLELVPFQRLSPCNLACEG
jgi:hypothetical protein